MNVPFRPKDDWQPINRPNLTARIPFAYKTDDADTSVFIPNMEVIPFLERALDAVDEGNSYRAVAEWLVEVSGHSITHQGLKYIWEKIRSKDPENPRVKEMRRKKRARAPKTPEQIKELAAKRALAAAKRSVSVRTKKLTTLVEQSTPKIEPEQYPKFKPSTADPEKDPLEGKDIIFKPNEGPQSDFLAASEQEVLYGGSAGGGKSYALLADPMRYFDNKNFRGILLRRTNDELRELIWKSKELYPRAFPGAKWKEKQSAWVFPSGAEFWLTYLERDEDVLRYQGQAFCYIAFDELTQYPTPFPWNYMRSRLRTTDPSLPLFMRATTNPGNVGHGWVKKMFIDPAPYNKPFYATDIDSGEVLVWGQNDLGYAPDTPLFMRRFIPAKLKDNPYLYKGGQYQANLLSLPEAERRRLLEGDWNIIDGAAFPEFRLRDHVIEPFEIPPSWRRFRSCDFGYSSFSAVHWFAIDPVYETLIVYRELYVSKMTGRALARKILEIEHNTREQILYGMLDSSVWHQRGQTGPSIAEEMISEGCRWRPADRSSGSRSNGYNRLHELLKIVEYSEDKKLPGIQFFNTCKQIIADLQVIPVSPHGEDDINDRYGSDHAYDSLRYGIMSRPRKSSPFDFENTKIMPSYRPADAAFGY